MGWSLDRWGAVRVAGLSVEVLQDLRMVRSYPLWAKLRAEESSLNHARDRLIDILYEEVSKESVSPATRSALLRLKRDLYNRRPLGLVPSLDTKNGLLRRELNNLAKTERHYAALGETFDTSIVAEWEERIAAILPHLGVDNVLGGLVLSNPVLAKFALKTTKEKRSHYRSPREVKRLMSVAKYVLRATTRPTPFSTFCSVGILNWEGGCQSSFLRPNFSKLVPQSRVQINVGLLKRYLSLFEVGDDSKLPLYAIPWRVVDGDSFVFPVVDHNSSDTSTTSWDSINGQDVEVVLAHISDAPTMAKLLARLARFNDNEKDWPEQVKAMAKAKFLLHRKAAVSPSAPGLQKTVGYAHELVGNDSALAEIAQDIARYATSSSKDRLRLMERVSKSIGCAENKHGVIYEDVVLGRHMPKPPVPSDVLLDIVKPVLQLAHSSLTDVPHMIMCEAFLAKYGLNGLCDDVAGFITTLWRDDSFLKRFHQITLPPRWLESRLVEAIEHSKSFCLDCPHSWFSELPTSADRADVSLFFQLWPGNSGGFMLAINRVQSGRGKYLSRFLNEEDPNTKNALADIRQTLASERPIPIEIKMTLGKNFQLHPTMCPFSFVLEDAMEPNEPKLEMSDLSLSFDRKSRQLVLWSARLKSPVEPLHLGFLRDQYLPIPVLLLRALSPRFRDETVSERAAVYSVLDERCLALGKAPPPFRPRLTVGHLVLERARWVVPIDEVPKLGVPQDIPNYMSCVFAWLKKHRLPDRCTAQVWQALPDGLLMLSPPQYVDWHSPYSTAILKGLARIASTALLPGGPWLILREVFPSTKDASVQVGKKLKVAEWMAQFSLRV